MPEQGQNKGNPAVQAPKRKYPKLPVHGILHYLRGHIEERHRSFILRQAVRGPGPPVLNLDNITRMRIGEIQSCCNKSAPIYILPHDSPSMWDSCLFHIVLHNYLYRTWFQPYRSEIDCGQFLAQPIIVRSTPPPPNTEEPAAAARFAVSMSRAICAHVEVTQQKIGDRGHLVTPLAELRAMAQELGISAESERIHGQKFLLLQPLFRAVAIVIQKSAYSIVVPAIARIPVLLVLTGVEEGLSAPITFESIIDKARAHHRLENSVQAVETSLATAVGFLMDLEKRELAALGPRPDPAETSKDPRRGLFLRDEDISFFARVRGWEGHEAAQGPSSGWVDLDIYPRWSGDGAEYDQRDCLTRGGGRRRSGVRGRREPCEAWIDPRTWTCRRSVSPVP